MINISEEMYSQWDDRKGRYSKGWVVFNNGLFDKKPVLIKYTPDKQPADRSLIRYVNKGGYEIPLVALNTFVAKAISRCGDPNGTVSDYFFLKQDGELFVGTTSFKGER